MTQVNGVDGEPVDIRKDQLEDPHTRWSYKQLNLLGAEALEARVLALETKINEVTSAYLRAANRELKPVADEIRSINRIYQVRSRDAI